MRKLLSIVLVLAAIYTIAMSEGCYVAGDKGSKATSEYEIRAQVREEVREEVDEQVKKQVKEQMDKFIEEYEKAHPKK